MLRVFQHHMVKRVAGAILIGLLVLVMTGPQGNGSEPTSGFTGSFSEHMSFFGFFTPPRWITFALLALVLSLLVMFAKYSHRAWRRAQESGAAAARAVASAAARVKYVRSRRSGRYSGYALLVLLGIFLPRIITSQSWQTNIVQLVAVYILLAIGLNVVTGFAGLLDLGFVAFYAIGAYTTAWVTGALPTSPPFGIHFNTFFAIPFAIILAMAFGVVLGIPTLRLRGDYLAIVTLGFGEIIFIFANNLYGITGGSTGTNQIPYLSVHLGPLKYLWGLTPQPYYYLTLAFIVLFLMIFSSLEHSRVGRAWVAIREDEVAAESLGIYPLKYKVMAFAIGAASAGFAGVITASQTLFVTPPTFSLSFSINILVLVIFGGMGSIAGVVVGGLVIQGFVVYMIQSPPAWYNPADLYMYLGALLIVMMIFRPAGLLPSRRRLREVTQVESGVARDQMLTHIGPHNRVEEEL
ncbi:MAG: branched-chain amino acid ABC transporter permease [Acidobacteriota bacterium]|nr:branched-chain amino acid ABC transporter permease [Acidobacteriota bacterium]MDE3092965.1 branched-chain amino acid ABC transporter permease [Acidobacteriota bacterium]MDE3146546.1 branched-chain amino acid ABC transporter permease [Acidobacteriota bacterium]